MGPLCLWFGTNLGTLLAVSFCMGQEPFIFRALRQHMLRPANHAAVDVYQRRGASFAEPYELIWRLAVPFVLKA